MLNIRKYILTWFNEHLGLKKKYLYHLQIGKIWFLYNFHLFSFLNLFMSSLILNFPANGSACIIYNNADIASPCLIPLVISKYSDWYPFVIMHDFALRHSVDTQNINLSPKLNLWSTLYNHDHSTRSNAFFRARFLSPFQLAWAK